MGLAGSDSARNAQQTVNTYFDKLVSGQMRIRPMPGALASLLRGGRYRISDPGVTGGLGSRSSGRPSGTRR
jgi:hypothetical protein